MSDQNSGVIKKFLETPNDNVMKTIIVALVLCLVCSVLVSASAVVLKPIQERNKLLDKQINILSVAGLIETGEKPSIAVVDQLFTNIKVKLVDVETGEYFDGIEASGYDQKKASKDPELNVVIPRKQDIARIKTRAKYAAVYLAQSEQGELETIILPIKGYGLWSTLYGFIAVAPDGQTVKGISFYAHAETPGLGGEVDNPKWKALWRGKKLYSEQGELKLTVIKGKAVAGHEHHVDGLSGATLTSVGVANLIKYWMGEQGFAQYLARFNNS